MEMPKYNKLFTNFAPISCFCFVFICGDILLLFFFFVFLTIQEYSVQFQNICLE